MIYFIYMIIATIRNVNNVYKFVVLAILYILGVNFTLKERQNSNNKSLIAAPSYIIIIGCTMLKIKLKQLMQVNFLSPI